MTSAQRRYRLAMEKKKSQTESIKSKFPSYTRELSADSSAGAGSRSMARMVLDYYSVYYLWLKLETW